MGLLPMSLGFVSHVNLKVSMEFLFLDLLDLLFKKNLLPNEYG